MSTDAQNIVTLDSKAEGDDPTDAYITEVHAISGARFHWAMSGQVGTESSRERARTAVREAFMLAARSAPRHDDIAARIDNAAHADLLSLIDQPGTFERITDTTPDGWIFDVQSGEVIGRADIPEAFVVDNHDRADWVLELRSITEGNLVGLRARRKAMNDHFDALERKEQQRLNWWDFRFRSSLVEFARKCLVGKSKTAEFVYGKVSFRATKGTNTILDMDAAVQWAKSIGWEHIVKVKETVTVTDVIKAHGDHDESLNWLKATGPSESITISTGVEP